MQLKFLNARFLRSWNIHVVCKMLQFYYFSSKGTNYDGIAYNHYSLQDIFKFSIICFLRYFLIARLYHLFIR